ncbi:MAG: class I SAM-dependent methyltransferase [Gammaproteobacteria bacterium]|nr:class I SAM-dependent methyltransferase [Gammaproteobacteria bacterium]
MWDERYSGHEYAYGKEPNDFLVKMQHYIPAGRVLCLAEGEGRNAVYLAKLGYEVTAVDSSTVGIDKTQRLADENGVIVKSIIADLAEFDIGERQWEGIVSIFGHLPPPIRRKVHRDVVKGLKPGGYLILEAYTPEQLNYKTGGPPVAEMMMSLEGLEAELDGLIFVHATETVRPIHEGEFHHGEGAVVDIVAKR